MSVDMYVLCTTALPLQAEWQIAVDRQNFPLELDFKFDPAKDSGFWPAKFKGTPTGFEFYKLKQSEWESRPAVRTGEHFFSGAQFASHNDIAGFLASILTAVAIARTCGGIVYDPQEDRAYRADEMDQLVQEASGMFESR